MLGCDSIRLEREWRLFNFEHCSPNDIKRVPIRGGMYEVRAYVTKQFSFCSKDWYCVER